MTFPFTAIVGQSKIKHALQLLHVDASLGGLLISGPRGSAKSTLVRSFADLCSAGALVTLPLGASEEMITGSFDLEKALGEAKVTFRPGLLAQADGGVLYIDEVNLLADHLVDLLLDAAASGVNIVERDGISHQHAARFVLVGTMNPEEGELRPQLLDRFGLMATVADELSQTERQQVVQNCLSHEANAAQFIAAHATELAAVKQRLDWAKQHIATVTMPPPLAEQIAARCAAAKVEGLRADLAWYRAARANAALQQRQAVERLDLEQVEPLVFAHRHSSLASPPAPPPTRSPATSPPAAPPPPASAPVSPSPPATAATRRADDTVQGSSHGSSITGSWGVTPPTPMPIIDRNLPPLLAGLTDRPIRPIQRAMLNPIAPTASTSPRPPSRDGRATARGLTRQPNPHATRRQVDWFRTLGRRAQGQVGLVNATTTHANHRDGLCYRYARTGHHPLHLVLLDTSASTLCGQGLAYAKGVVLALARASYQQRQPLAVLTFGNDAVQTALHPQRAPRQLRACLAAIHGGGGTPMARALTQADHLMRRHRHRYTECLLYLLTDGRLPSSPETIANHPALARGPVVIIDIETSRIKLSLAKQLATTIGGAYAHVEWFAAACGHEISDGEQDA